MKRLSIFLIIISLTFPFLNEQVYADSIEATDIKLNTEYSDRLSTDKEIDFFKFNLPADGNVVVTFRHEGFSDSTYVHWSVYLYGEADLEKPLGYMAIKATDRSASFSTAIGAGTYLVKVTSQADMYGRPLWWDDQYFLAVNFEESDFYEKSPNHNPNQATTLELNTEYSANLAIKGDVDFFKFNLPANGNVVVSFKHEEFSDNTHVHWNVYLYSETDIESPLGSMAIKATDKSTSFSTGIGVGTYLIKVTPQYSGRDIQYWWDDQYFLAVNFEESDFYEKSPNRNPNQATRLDLNTEYAANLAIKGDIDFFTFSLPVDGKVNLSFRHSELGDQNTYWNVHLYEETNLETAIKSIAIKGSEQSVFSSEVPINAGLYFIKVTPQYSGRDVRYWWWDQYFLKVQTDVAEPVCPQVITYGKNPVSGSWIAFPTPCDVPENWITQNTQPDGPCPVCPDAEVVIACPDLEISKPTIAATLSPTFELHIPDVQHEGMSFWADLVNVPSSDENLLFQVTDYGQN